MWNYGALSIGLSIGAAVTNLGAAGFWIWASVTRLPALGVGWGGVGGSIPAFETALRAASRRNAIAAGWAAAGALLSIAAIQAQLWALR
jgi:hypothetical protein